MGDQPVYLPSRRMARGTGGREQDRAWGASRSARLIYSWDNLAMDSNDRAVEYLHQIQPPGLDLNPIDMALACRQEKCTAEEVFALHIDLMRQCESAVRYISVNRS